MRLKETNAVRSDVGSLDWSVDGRLHPESLQWGWIWSREIYRNQAPPWFGFNKSHFCADFPKTHWNENCLTSGSGYSSNEPGAPSTLRPRQWSGSLYSKDFVPRRLEKVTFPQKRHFSPYRSHPRIEEPGSCCLFLWAQSVGMSSAGGLFDLFAVCEPVSHGSHTHMHIRE